MKPHGRIMVVAALLAFSVGWWWLLDRIGDRIHSAAMELSTQPSFTPMPESYFHDGESRLETYGAANCVWVRAHMQRGKWMEGYWRRKPHVEVEKAP